MSIFTRIRDFLVPAAPPALRNKPGGLAWVNSNVDEGGGTEVLVHRVVRVVRLADADFWRVDPPLEYVATARLKFANGFRADPGDRIVVGGVRDHCLTPIDGNVTSEEVEQLYQPGPQPTVPA